MAPSRLREVWLEADLTDHLLSEANRAGVTVSEYVRQRVIPGPASPRNGRPVDGGQRATPPSHSAPISELAACLGDARFPVGADAVDQFLFVLSWIHERDPQEFARVLDMKGPKRHYFGRSESDFRGLTSPNPKQIPGTPYWVDTRLDNPSKGQKLSKVLALLGYSSLAQRQARELFE